MSGENKIPAWWGDYITHDVNYVNNLAVTKKLQYQFDEYKKSSQDNTSKNIALVIRGQLRSFCLPRVYSNFFNFIDFLKKDGFNPVCFFHVNKAASYVGAEWHYDNMVRSNHAHDRDDAIDKIKVEHGEYNKASENFESIMIESEVEYVVDFYDEDFFTTTVDENKQKTLVDSRLGSDQHVHRFQWAATDKCNLMLKEYEAKNNLKFGNVIKIRPDLTYGVHKTESFNRESVYFQWDSFRFYPRYVFDFLVDHKKEMFDWLEEHELHRGPKGDSSTMSLHQLMHYVDLFFLDDFGFCDVKWVVKFIGINFARGI